MLRAGRLTRWARQTGGHRLWQVRLIRFCLIRSETRCGLSVCFLRRLCTPFQSRLDSTLYKMQA